MVSHIGAHAAGSLSLALRRKFENAARLALRQELTDFFLARKINR